MPQAAATPVDGAPVSLHEDHPPHGLLLWVWREEGSRDCKEAALQGHKEALLRACICQRGEPGSSGEGGTGFRQSLSSDPASHTGPSMPQAPYL